MGMVERTIFDVVQDGLKYYTDDPARFERFLVLQNGLSADEADKARRYFAGDASNDARPPTLLHGYARQGGPFPCWAMTLGAEDIPQDYLGKGAASLDSSGDLFLDPETGEVVDPKIRRFRYRFDILVHTNHPDITVWYYQLLKQILMENQDELEERNVEEMILGGADMAPVARYLPNDVYTRKLTLTVDGDECWFDKINDGTGSKVGGIHFENIEGTRQGVGVTAKVVPVTD